MICRCMIKRHLTHRGPLTTKSFNNQQRGPPSRPAIQNDSISLLAAILFYRTRLLSSVTILLIEVNRGLIDFSHWLQRDNSGVVRCLKLLQRSPCWWCLWDVFITLSNGHDHRGQNREKLMAQHMWVCLTLSFILLGFFLMKRQKWLIFDACTGKYFTDVREML